MTIIEICGWCGYMHEKMLVENDYDNNDFICPCCDLDVVEIHEI